MAWFAAALPYISAGATAASAASTLAAGKQNAANLKVQAIAANQQTQADEEAARRQSRALLGKQAAAIAEAGLNYDGTTGLIADQSATMAELDALNIRYQGRMRAMGLVGEANAESRNSRRLAGQQLLAGATDMYTSGVRLPRRAGT